MACFKKLVLYIGEEWRFSGPQDQCDIILAGHAQKDAGWTRGAPLDTAVLAGMNKTALMKPSEKIPKRAYSRYD
jgi:hypothetical protein